MTSVPPRTLFTWLVCALLGAGLATTLVTASPAAFTRTSARRTFHRHRPRPLPPPGSDPAAVTVGERLFLETRFAQFFADFLAGGGNVNDPLPTGDPTMDFTVTPTAPLPGPFAGMSINCRSCHLVDEQVGIPDGGMRTYTDFATRSPVPQRVDGQAIAPRNSPPLVNAFLKRDVGLLLHFDGEFVALPDLVRSTLTGRNFGWLPRESTNAIAHIARIIRRDNGQGDLAQEFGGLSYRVVLTGTDPSIPDDFKISKRFRVDVAHATDRQIVDAVVDLISAYTEQLAFSTDEQGHNLSPFDVFLELNGLLRQPPTGADNLAYSRRLLKKVGQLEAGGTLQFVSTNPNTTNGLFEFHPNQAFAFGPEELQGLKTFFAEPKNLPLTASEVAAGGTGNCIACHAAPAFTDFRVHNTGASQVEYDAIHGATTFEQLSIPGLGQRLAHHDQYLPATPQHPDAAGVFRAVPDANAPQLTDLGVWNVFANPDFPKPQARLRQILCDVELSVPVPPFLVPFLSRCTPASLLPKTVGVFKTPGLRDLSHSAPYMHNGQFSTLAGVIDLYRQTSALARARSLRNGAKELQGIALRSEDVAPLVAFLRSLNEDYQ